jgi:hypothetical protein
MKLQFRLHLSVFLAAASGFLLASAIAYAAAGGLTVRQARELLQNIAGASLKKDQVQILKISGGITGNDAIVEAQIETAFRVIKEKGNWRIAEVRFGDRQWESFELIEEAVRREKIRRTSLLLKKMAEAIEAYRKDFGQIPATKDIATLLDHISPRYITSPERFDYWGRQFEFRVEEGGYRLISSGPDLKSGTRDDLVVENGVLKVSLE